MKYFKTKLAIFVSMCFALALPAMAAVDTTGIVTEISSNSTAITTVGGALLALAAVAVGIKWLKGTIFS